MQHTIRIIPRTLVFKKPAGTSRGVMLEHKVWYVLMMDQNGFCGVGECAPLPGLSSDALPQEQYMQILKKNCQELEQKGTIDFAALQPYPSILFGLETALQHLKSKSFALWGTPFSRGHAGIPINGLIWMGDYSTMLEQIEAKMQQGFSCIKLKIGAIDFEREVSLIQHIRKSFSAKEITIRVDANGAFSTADALDKLKKLAELELHSIEQPIKAGQWDALSKLVQDTPLPIALDEELIGVLKPDQKKQLLDIVKPHYLVLKPSLHGGINGSTQWIELAEKCGIGWWVTSALESNIGLNAIAQWCATLKPTIPQGLGTGLLYKNNIDLPLHIQKDTLWFDPADHNIPKGTDPAQVFVDMLTA